MQVIEDIYDGTATNNIKSLEDVDYEVAKMHNQNICAPSRKPPKRELFFKEIIDGKQIKYTVYRIMPIIMIKQNLKYFLAKCRLIRMDT